MIRKRKSSFKPCVEVLEVRCLLSAGVLQWSETLPASAVSAVQATAIQADGKIVVVGGEAVVGGYFPNEDMEHRIRVGRRRAGPCGVGGRCEGPGRGSQDRPDYPGRFRPGAVGQPCLHRDTTAAGKPDPSFNRTGTLIAVDSPVSTFTDVVVQGSAAAGYKMVLTGTAPATSTSPYFSTVTRYSLTGALDMSFGGAGTGSFTLGNHTFWSLVLEADGSIIVGGHRSVTSDGTTHFELAVGHLSADGIVDTSFGSNGTGFSYAQVGANTRSSPQALAIDPLTGDIVLGGWITDTSEGNQGPLWTASRTFDGWPFRLRGMATGLLVGAQKPIQNVGWTILSVRMGQRFRVFFGRTGLSILRY